MDRSSAEPLGEGVGEGGGRIGFFRGGRRIRKSTFFGDPFLGSFLDSFLMRFYKILGCFSDNIFIFVATFSGHGFWKICG